MIGRLVRLMIGRLGIAAGGVCLTSLLTALRSWNTSRHGADTVNVRLQPRHAPLVGSGPAQQLPGSLGMLAAMRRAGQPLAPALPFASDVVLSCWCSRSWTHEVWLLPKD